MYKVGAFTEYGDKKQPGVYTRLSSTPSSGVSSLTNGGIALPWKTFARVSEPEPERLQKNTLSTYADSQYLANPDAFFSITTNILSNATDVWVCPYNTRVKETVTDGDIEILSEGWSEDGNVHIIMEPKTKTYQTSFMPMIVGIELGNDEKYHVTLTFPFPFEYKNEYKAAFPAASVVDGGAKTCTIAIQDANEGKELRKVYGDEIKLHITVKTLLTRALTVMICGGRAKITTAKATIVNDEVNKTAGMTAGALIALPYDQTNHQDIPDHDLLYVKDTVVPAGTPCFGVVELKNQTVTLYLYNHDERTGKTKVRQVETNTYKLGTDEPKESTATIRQIIQSLRLIDGGTAYGEKNTDAWGKHIGENQELRVGFVPFHDHTKNAAQETLDFMPTVGRTNAGTVFHVPDTRFFDETRANNQKTYQLIQGTYINNTGSLCPGTQLAMDETWIEGCQRWGLNTEPLTVSSPFCVSLAGDQRGGFYSLQNSAFMVGIMAKCGVVRTATAARYPGTDLEIYSQSIIERMHDVGVVSWHSHAGEKLIYIDSSSYRKDRKSFDGAEYSDAFERNRPVRAVNRFRMDAAQNFIRNYFEQNWYGDDAAGAIRRDLLMLIHEMADAGVFVDDIHSDDVLVTDFGSRSFTANVRLRLVESPEILYISLEV